MRAFLLLLLVMVPVLAQDCNVYCSSCSECASAIDNGLTVCLDGNIAGNTTIYISGKDNWVLDCNGNIIEGCQISVYDSSGWEIRNCVIRGVYGDGVYISHSDGNLAQVNVCENAGRGVVVDQGSSVSIYDSNIHKNAKNTGILVYGYHGDSYTHVYDSIICGNGDGSFEGGVVAAASGSSDYPYNEGHLYLHSGTKVCSNTEADLLAWGATKNTECDMGKGYVHCEDPDVAFSSYREYSCGDINCGTHSSCDVNCDALPCPSLFGGGIPSYGDYNSSASSGDPSITTVPLASYSFSSPQPGETVIETDTSRSSSSDQPGETVIEPITQDLNSNSPVVQMPTCGEISGEPLDVCLPYVMPITIVSNEDTLLCGQEVKIVLDTQSLISQGKLDSDCNSIRFVWSDGNIMLPYWIESGCNTPETVIWVRVHEIPEDGNVTIYMYHGTGAPPDSNGDAVFDFFDDFESMDTSVWYLPSGTSYSVANSILRINQGSAGLQSPLFPLEGYFVEAKVRYLDSTNKYSGVLETSSSQFTAGSNANSDATVLYMRDAYATTTVRTWIGSGSSASYDVASAQDVFSSSNNTWYVLGIRILEGGVELYKDYSLQKSYTASWSKDMNFIALGAFNGSGSYDNQDTEYDWVRARKDADVTVVLGSDSNGYDYDGDGHSPVVCGGDDCNDLDANVHPGVPEVCNDGKDNDCDGLVDSDDPDCSLNLTLTEVGPLHKAFKVGKHYTFNVYVSSSGYTGNVNVGLFVDGNIVDTISCAAVAGGICVAHVSWTPSHVGTDLNFVVDPDNTVEETDETDNYYDYNTHACEEIYSYDVDEDGNDEYWVDCDGDDNVDHYLDEDDNVYTETDNQDYDGDPTIEYGTDVDEDGVVDGYFDPDTNSFVWLSGRVMEAYVPATDVLWFLVLVGLSGIIYVLIRE